MGQAAGLDQGVDIAGIGLQPLLQARNADIGRCQGIPRNYRWNRVGRNPDITRIEAVDTSVTAAGTCRRRNDQRAQPAA